MGRAARHLARGRRIQKKRKSARLAGSPQRSSGKGKRMAGVRRGYH